MEYINPKIELKEELPEFEDVKYEWIKEEKEV